MPFWLLPMLISGGLSLVKHFAVDKPKADKDRTLAAKTQELSPYTGLKAQPVEDPNLFGGLMSGAAAGAQFGTSIHQAEQADDINKIYGDWIKTHSLRDPEAAMFNAPKPFSYSSPSMGGMNNSWGLLK